MARAADEPTYPIDWDAVDWEAVDRATLALLVLGVHDGYRTWKGFSWEAMDRLHEAGMISDPKGKAKSVTLTDEGFERAHELFKQLFYARDK